MGRSWDQGAWTHSECLEWLLAASCLKSFSPPRSLLGLLGRYNAKHSIDAEVEEPASDVLNHWAGLSWTHRIPPQQVHPLLFPSRTKRGLLDDVFSHLCSHGQHFCSALPLPSRWFLSEEPCEILQWCQETFWTQPTDKPQGVWIILNADLVLLVFWRDFMTAGKFFRNALTERNWHDRQVFDICTSSPCSMWSSFWTAATCCWL